MPAKQKKSKLKLKTHKAAASRIHVTGSGKLMHLKARQSHLRRKKPARVKRQFGDKLPVAASDVSRLRRLLPYGAP
jgi:large subunit ribosomal protein L35